MPILARAARRVPILLWIRLMFGQWLVQISAAIVGIGSFAFAHWIPQGPEDPPRPLVAGILVIGCIPVLLVGIGRARRVLYMLREGPFVDGRLKDPIGEQQSLALDGIPGAPAIEGDAIRLGRRPFVLPLFVLPLVAFAGVFALASA